MIIKAECTIDLDEKRRVWSEVQIECEDLEGVKEIAEAAADAALRAYNRARSAKVAEQDTGVPRTMGS